MVEVRPRLRGVPINGDILSQLMAERDLQADELAQLAGVTEDTISRARRGQRIERKSLRKLTDALLRVPVNPLMAKLVTKNEKPVTEVQTVTGEEGRGGRALDY
jgi:transcriptional regulator with XRE-family HTH domain